MESLCKSVEQRQVVQLQVAAVIERHQPRKLERRLRVLVLVLLMKKLPQMVDQTIQGLVVCYHLPHKPQWEPSKRQEYPKGRTGKLEQVDRHSPVVYE